VKRLTATLVMVLSVLSECTSTPDSAPAGIDHRAGANALSVHGYYGVPILQKSFVWDGNGEEDNFGLGVRAWHFVDDGLAVGAGLNAAIWKQGDREIPSGEIEALGRWYPGEDCGFFLDVNGGYLHAHDPVPAGGTEWNFSFGFGAGYEIPVGPGSSLLIGAAYHHISNALGRDNPRNPSQNEVHFWIGFVWNF
jgi:Lipid A 3-O-deacylase (PagL)